MTALPPPCPSVPALRATDASTTTRAVRLAASLVADVHAEVVAGGAAAGAGRAHDAADESTRGFARHADAAVAALEVATRGCERFEQEVVALAQRRVDLVARADALDADIREAERLPPDLDTATRLWHRRGEVLAARTRLLADEEDAEDALVRLLRSVDSAAEAAVVADDPDRADAAALARELRGTLGRPDAVRRWWAGLTPAERAALLVSDPDLVVNADGLPAAARDDAGRTALARDLRIAEGRERRLLEALRDALARGGPGTLLLLYDRRGDGRGAVAYGDPDTSERTVVLVPGLGTDLGSIDDLGRRALDLRAEVGGSTSVVVWVGYDAPDLTIERPGDLLDAAGVLDERAARAGAADLVRFVDGLRGSDEGDPSRLTVVGHSYGSTTTAIAAVDGLDADAVVLLASPGAGDAHHASDLAGAGGSGGTEIYVGSRDRDPVTWLGGDGPGGPGLGADPAQDDFGGTRIDVGDGRPFHADGLGPVGLHDNHTTYFEPGSEALDNLADVVEGERPDVVPGRGDPAHDLLTDWLADEVQHQAESLVDSLTFWR